MARHGWNTRSASPKTLSRIIADKADPTLYHVMMKHKRTGKLRSFYRFNGTTGNGSVRGGWSEGRSPGTSMRFVNDLHDRTKRDILERRINGEKIDHNGVSTEEERKRSRALWRLPSADS